MRWRDAAAVVLGSSAIFEGVAGKVVTVFEFPTSCRAVYTSGTHSFTVTVSPTPFNDGGVNSHGEPFILEVRGYEGLTKRVPAPNAWVMADGSTTINETHATQYLIKKGQLTSIHGDHVSTYTDVNHVAFALGSTLRDISTTFSVHNEKLHWKDSNFTNGQAKFYEIFPAGRAHQGQILAYFAGPISEKWNAVTLVAMPPGVASTSSSKTHHPHSSTSMSSQHGSGHTHSHKSKHTKGGGTKHHSHTMGTYHNHSMATGASAHPSATGNVSPDGFCGGTGGYTCSGSPFGECCSGYDYCGTGDSYCGTGCQPLFGTCSRQIGGAGGVGIQSMPSLPAGSSSMSSMSIGVTSLSVPPNSGSTTIPQSTYTSPAGPIGPVNPLGPNGTVVATSSASQTSSMAPACPTSSSAACSSPDDATTCSSSSGTTYNESCGLVYTGNVIDTSNVVGLPSQRKRATEYSLGDCRTLCDRYAVCIAFNYLPNNCILLSHITGSSPIPGAIGGMVPTDDVAAKTDGPGMGMPATTTSTAVISISLSSGTNPVTVIFTPSSTMAMSSAMLATTHSSSHSAAMSTHSSSSMMMSSPGPSPSSSQMAASTSSHMMASSSAGAMASSSSTHQAMSSSSHQMAMSSSTMHSSTAPMGSSTPMPSPEPVCPQANGTAFADTAGREYVILCGMDFTPGAYDVAQATDFASCINACGTHAAPTCVGVSFTGMNSNGACYFKSGYVSDSANAMINAAVLASALGVNAATLPTYTPSSSMAMSTSIASSSGSQVMSSTMQSSSSMMTSAPTSTQPTSSSMSSSSVSTNYLILPSPTPCDFGDGPNYDEDDSFCEIALPFTMQMYAQTDTNSYASTNGYISILNGGSQYSNQQFPASNIPANSVAPFFDDLYLVGTSSPQDGIFYQFNTAQTAITYEYYLNRGKVDGTADTTETYHFTVYYDSTEPGMFTYTYYQTGGSADNGVNAAVGIQGENLDNSEQGFTYSYRTADITPGLVVLCNTNANICVTRS